MGCGLGPGSAAKLRHKRKHYLFAGSDAGAPRAETIYSVLGTAALVGVEPIAYLRDVLDRISRGWPGNRVEELLPDA